MTITRASRKRRPSADEGAAPSAEGFIEAAPHAEEPVPVSPTALSPSDATSADAGISEPSSAEPTPSPNAIAARRTRARAIIRRHLPWAAGAGAVPVPAVDLAAIIGVQLRMLSEIGAEYGVTFKSEAARTITGTLMAAVLQSGLAGGLASALKVVPGLGTAVGILALPALAMAGTQALGKVFITHFESGGTFLDFDPDRVERHFRQEFERARTGHGV